jgi:hypothetical protein
MTNQNNSDSPAADPKDQSPPQPPMIPVAPAEREISGNPKKCSDPQQDTAKELAREFRWVEFAQLAINGVLAIVGIIALLIYHGQLDVMRGQLGEIVKQYPEIKKSAEANVAASQAATESLKTIGKQFQLDQRPFVTVVCCKTSDISGNNIPPTIGKAVGANIEIHNVGKSPAFNLFTHYHFLFGSDVMKIRADAQDTIKSEGILPQGGPGIFVTALSVKNTYTVDTNKLNPSELVEWDGAQPIVVFGRVTYNDTFGNSYCTPCVHMWLHDHVWADVVGKSLIDKRNHRTHKIPNMCPSQTPF